VGIQIGRAGRTLPLSEPTSWKVNSGGQVTVEALIKMGAGTAIASDDIETLVGSNDQAAFRSLGGSGADGTLNAWSQDVGAFSIASGVVTVPANASARMHAGSPEWTDGRYRVRVNWVTGAMFRGLVHFADANNFIRLQLTGTAFALFKLVGGVQTSVNSQATTPVNGTWYWIELVCSGTTYTATLYADTAGAIGAQIVTTGAQTIADAAVQAGSIGVGSGAAVSFTLGGLFDDVCSWYTDGHGYAVTVTSGEPAFAVTKTAPYAGTYALAITAAHSSAQGTIAKNNDSNIVSGAKFVFAGKLSGGATGTATGTVSGPPSVSVAGSTWKLYSVVGAVTPAPIVAFAYGGGVGTAYFDAWSILSDPILDMMVLKDQVLGLQNNADEPVVPVIIPSLPRLSGYYRVDGVSVGLASSAFGGVSLPIHVDLTPVQGFTAPAIEAILTGALLTNSVGAVSGDATPIHCVPSLATEYFALSGAGRFIGGRVAEDASLDVNLLGSTYAVIARYSLAPADYYKAAAKFEQGSPLFPVMGRLMAQADTLNWRLSNGLIRITPNAQAGGTGSTFNVSHYNGSTWSKPKGFTVGSSGGVVGSIGTGIGSSIQSVTVLRNSPEEVVIRLVVGNPPAYTGRVFVDLSLRRGDVMADLFLSSDLSLKWQVFRQNAEAATAITFGAVTAGGIRATANDSDGNRYILLSYQAATTTSLANGALTQNAFSTSFDAAIGAEIGGSGAGTPNVATAIAGQYLAAQAETQRIVAR
jgi:hypothetical protein